MKKRIGNYKKKKKIRVVTSKSRCLQGLENNGQLSSQSKCLLVVEISSNVRLEHVLYEVYHINVLQNITFTVQLPNH